MQYIDVLPFTITVNAGQDTEKIFTFALNRTESGFHAGYVFDGEYIINPYTKEEIIAEDHDFGLCMENLYFKLDSACFIDENGFVKDNLEYSIVNQ